MCQIAFSVPDEVLFDTKMSREQANQFARRYVALGFYKQNGVSIGYCSQIAGMTEAKKTAKYLGLTVTGTLGVLVKAKRQGIIEEVRSLLSEMRQNGFYVSKTVESMVLEQAGE